MGIGVAGDGESDGDDVVVSTVPEMRLVCVFYGALMQPGL